MLGIRSFPTEFHPATAICQTPFSVVFLLTGQSRGSLESGHFLLTSCAVPEKGRKNRKAEKERGEKLGPAARILKRGKSEKDKGGSQAVPPPPPPASVIVFLSKLPLRLAAQRNATQVQSLDFHLTLSFFHPLSCTTTISPSSVSPSSHSN